MSHWGMYCSSAAGMSDSIGLMMSDISLYAEELIYYNISYSALYPRRQPWFNCDIHQEIYYISLVLIKTYKLIRARAVTLVGPIR